MNGDMLDTNVIIKYLAGDESAKSFLQYKSSGIPRIEVCPYTSMPSAPMTARNIKVDYR